jgi:single-strand DNA-binding protein
VAGRSLNKVQLIGNLTRDPELRYTPQGTAVCTFGLATNRQWKTESGDSKDEVEYHRIVAWDKLGEICSQMLKKGSRTYCEGRIQTRKWTGQDNVERTTVEIVISDMIVLDPKRSGEEVNVNIPEDVTEAPAKKSVSKKEPAKEEPETNSSDVIDDSDIPF